ncbi:hypothetical protein K402DRAFT_431041 [Aulographum hederae CBS 113979]|uniref:Uncharacterized protein n=1 Tax=Aulographum hederae CBS 113979 TaxID=1176131 RepID=A0A6G1H0D7_9PEZI|nr:hypothetical protein K402DRAFT_431041 [Aulographum hederae CBS 113979]
MAAAASTLSASEPRQLERHHVRSLTYQDDHAHPRRPSYRRVTTSIDRKASLPPALGRVEGTPTPSTRLRADSAHNAFINRDDLSLESAVTPDGDAISYERQFLAAWGMSRKLWLKLPNHLKESVAAIQHAGAAALTGFSRLEDMGLVLEREPMAADLSNSSCSSEDEHSDEDRKHKRTKSSSSASSVLGPISPIDPFTLRLNGQTSSPYPSPAPQVGGFSWDTGASTPGFIYDSNTMSGGLSRTISTSGLLSPGAATGANFHPPTNPGTSRRMAELTHLRSHSLVRIRHMVRRCDVDFAEWKREATLASMRDSSSNGSEDTEDEDAIEEFESWWEGSKALAREMEAKGNRLVELYGGMAGECILCLVLRSAYLMIMTLGHLHVLQLTIHEFVKRLCSRIASRSSLLNPFLVAGSPSASKGRQRERPAEAAGDAEEVGDHDAIYGDVPGRQNAAISVDPVVPGQLDAKEMGGGPGRWASSQRQGAVLLRLSHPASSP